MRLIDADKLKSHYSWWNNEEQRTFDQIVDAQPTVETVVHGKWIDDKSTIVGDIIERYCSLCGQRMTSCIDRLMPYCPNCGAKMDLEG